MNELPKPATAGFTAVLGHWLKEEIPSSTTLGELDAKLRFLGVSEEVAEKHFRAMVLEGSKEGAKK